MSSLFGSGSNTASSIFTGGIIAAIVIGSVVVLALGVGVVLCIYCLCCQTGKANRSNIVQPQPYPTPYNQAPPYGAYPPYYQPMNRF